MAPKITMNDPADINWPIKPTIRSIAVHTWWLFSARPGTFFMLAFAAYLPVAVFPSLIRYSAPDGPHALSLRLAFVAIGVVTQFLAAILICAAHNTIVGKDNTLGSMLNPVLRRWAPLLLMFVVQSLIFSLIYVLATELLMSFLIPRISLVIICNILLGSFLGAAFSVSIPLCLIGEKGAIASLKNSPTFIKGHFFKIFILVALISLAGYYLQYMITTFLPGQLFFNIHLAALPVAALFMAFEYVMFTVIYYDLADWRDVRLTEVFH